METTDIIVTILGASFLIIIGVYGAIDGEFTIKYLRKDGQGMYLEPANEAFPNIRPETALEIYGEMTGLIRKEVKGVYHWILHSSRG